MVDTKNGTLVNELTLEQVFLLHLKGKLSFPLLLFVVKTSNHLDSGQLSGDQVFKTFLITNGFVLFKMSSLILSQFFASIRKLELGYYYY